MANRTTVKAKIVEKNVPTVTNAILTDMLNAEMCDNIKFNEDVAVVQIATSSSITVDFTGKDRVDLTRTGGSLAITVSGMEDGERKYLLITKTVGQRVAFVGVTDITTVAYNVSGLDRVLYEIVRKGIYYYARAWVSVGQATTSNQGIIELAITTESNILLDDEKAVTPATIPIGSTSQRGIFEAASSSEIDAGTDSAGTDSGGRNRPLVVIPSELIRKLATITTQPSWRTGSIATGWTGTIKYFKDTINNVHVVGKNIRTTSPITTTVGKLLFNLPSGYRPTVADDISYPVRVWNTGDGRRWGADVRVYLNALYFYTGYSYTMDGAHEVTFYIIFRVE